MNMLCYRNWIWAAPVLAALWIAGCGGAEEGLLDTQADGGADDDQTTASTTSRQLVSATEKELIEALRAIDATSDGGNKVEAGTEKQQVFFVDPNTGQPTQKLQAERDVMKFSDDTWVLHGLYRERYPDGKKYQQGSYHKGQRVGEWTFWHRNGQVAKVVHYKDGKEDGNLTVYRDDGTKELVREYKAGKKHGKWLSFDEAGEKPNAQQEFKDGLPHGAWVGWYDSGQKREERLYKHGLVDGTVTRWHENGQIAQRTHYTAGRRHGLDTVYNASGRKIREIRYDEGKVVPNVDP